MLLRSPTIVLVLKGEAEHGYIPMSPIPEKEDSKEVRLFGEKSIREEAYRQKILQLEKDIMQLQSQLADQQKKPQEYQDSHLPEYSEGIFYEAAASLDEKVKKYHHGLEAKARDISERLNLQAHNLMEHEKIHSHVVVTKIMLAILSVLTIAALTLSAFSVYTAFRKNRADIQTLDEGKADYIKTALQENGFYNNQYTIISLAYYNRGYKAVVQLDSKPHNNWAFKTMASDIIETFKKISPEKSIEINFIYEGDAYAKVDFSHLSNDIHYEFFKKGTVE